MSDSATALPPDPFTTSLSGRRLGRYEVLARLASGGMAGVYVARALGVAGFERLFAVKVLHPHLAHEQEFITMFLDEARLAARIRHPNVVPTIDISDTQDAGYYLVMDYIEGDHLGALLQKAYKQGSRLPAPAALRIVVDTLEGLAAAHSLVDEYGRRINLVHRDVSPHNIMVSTDGIARITDFGVAKAEVRLSTTRQGQFKGKLAYMAPEHASTGEADQRSDLFSVAIILWECLTGRRLFRAENQAATLNKICIEPIPLPSSVDPALAPFDPVLERGLAREPEARFQTAEEFAEAIEERAEALGGLANQRAVAKLVRELAAEKVERDRELIRSAIAEVSAHTPSEPVPVTPAVEVAQPALPIPPAPAAPPIALPAPAAMTTLAPATGGVSRWQAWALGALVMIAVGLALLAFLKRGEQAKVISQPLPPIASAPAAAPPEPTPPPQPPSASTQSGTTSSGATSTTQGSAAPAKPPSTGPGSPAMPAPADRTRVRHEAAPKHATTATLPDKPPPPVEKPRRPKTESAPEVELNPYR